MVVSGRQGATGMNERNGAMVNGALIALGAVAILDNVVAHWLLGLHRAVPDDGTATVVEIGVVVVGVVLLLVGVARERRARRR